eukprot:284308_1
MSNYSLSRIHNKETAVSNCNTQMYSQAKYHVYESAWGDIVRQIHHGEHVPSPQSFTCNERKYLWNDHYLMFTVVIYHRVVMFGYSSKAQKDEWIHALD